MSCLQNRSGHGNVHKSLEVRDRDDILTAMQMTRTLAEELGFSAEETLFLQLATEEACTNAQNYGALEHSGYFEIKWRADAPTIEIVICQESRTFDVDLSTPAALAKGGDVTRGRGLVLIAGIMDELHLARSGTRVELTMRKTRKLPRDAT
ncbi:ATP-binding protein [Paenibacillus ginsengarvi]|uniref:ATP-binding protein n=1 Tax=Paenibacillus ginsengarvi TaxID=400777 RepID=A0A3B0C707_9BACL|nr:ATP-binding protein [Paenibacillus ginsengarvi]RKN82015.1 ATP-binding protein [Paenibacillus ginsengarvi]